MSDSGSKNALRFKPYLPLIFAIVLLVGVQLGIRLAPKAVYQENLRKETNFQKLKDILHFVQENYVDSIDDNKLMDNIIDDVLGELNPHSFYISPSKLDNVKENLQGNFEGIGIEFFIVEDTITVVSPISGGPSEALGILSGDKIISIEDTIVAGVEISNDDVVSKLRGEKGSEVRIEVKRFGENELLPFTITRAKIPLFSLDVSYMINDETAYMKVNRFSATTYKEFSTALRELKSDGMKSLILDLRGNPGGYLSAATEIVDEFIGGKKLVVYTEGKSSNRKEYVSRKPGLFEDGELYVLIDEGSASASEIVAGAIQDWDRGTLVGRRSFGKGLVQEQYNLSDGSALRLTVARYYTPSGRSIQKPYSDGSEKYYQELVQRMDNGEYFSEDSIKGDNTSIFYTADGRKVFGGGGITPDVFIPIDTNTNRMLMGRIRSTIPEYIYGYFSSNKDQFDKYEDVEQFISGFDITADMFSDFEEHVHAARPKLENQSFKDIQGDCSVYLKAYLAKQLWKNEGYYPVINQLDPAIEEIMNMIHTEANPLTAK